MNSVSYPPDEVSPVTSWLGGYAQAPVGFADII
jgi:hypothetical protein